MRRGYICFFAVLSLFLVVLFASVPRYSYTDVASNGVGFVGVKPVINVGASRFLYNGFDWVNPDTGDAYSTVSWSYGITVYMKNIAELNATVKLQAKLSTATSWVDIDSFTVTEYVPSSNPETKTFSDSGSEDISVHMQRFVDNPQSGTTYTIEYRLVYDIVAFDTQYPRSNPLTVSGQTDVLDSGSAKYQSVPQISQIILAEIYTEEGATYTINTDVTSDLTDGDTDTWIAPYDVGVSEDSGIYTYVFDVYFTGSGDVVIKVFVGEHAGGPFQGQIDLYVADTKIASYEGDIGAGVWVSGEATLSSSPVTIRVDVASLESYSLSAMEDFVTELRFEQPTSSWIYMPAGFVLGFLAAFVVLAGWRRRR